MTITAELADGRKLEFPDGTDPQVIQDSVRRVISRTPPGISRPEGVPEIEEGITPIAPAAGPRPPLGETIVEEIPQALGGVAGGLLAGGAGVGLAPIVGAVALGAGAGKAFQQIGQTIAGDPRAPQTSREAAINIGKAALTEAGFEFLGGGITKVAKKLLAPFAKRVTPEAEAVLSAFKDKVGPVVLLPAEATDSRILDIFQNVAESSIIGGGKIADFKVARDKFFGEFADDLANQFGEQLEPDVLGQLFVDSVNKNKSAFNTASDVLYNNVSEKIGSKIENVPITREIVSELLDESGNPITRTVTELTEQVVSPVNIPTEKLKDFTGPIELIFKDLKGLDAKTAGDDLISFINDLPKTIDFDTAKELRSRLLNRIDEFTIANPKAKAIGKAKRLISIVDESITEALKEQAPEALAEWRIANAFFKNGKKQFDNKFIRSLIRMAEETGIGAEAIAPKLFQPRQVTRVKNIKNALDPKDWQKMKGFFIQHLLQKSTDVDGAIKGAKLLNNLTGKPNSFGLPMLKEILNPAQLKEITNLGNALKLTQAKQAEGAGKIFIQLGQFGALISLGAGKFQAQAAAILFGPPVIAKMLLNPTMAKLLTQGVQLPANSPQAAGLITRLIAASIRIQQEQAE